MKKVNESVVHARLVKDEYAILSKIARAYGLSVGELAKALLLQEVYRFRLDNQPLIAAIKKQKRQNIISEIELLKTKLK